MARRVPKNIMVDLSLLEDIEGLCEKEGISFSAYAHKAFAHMLIHELSGEKIDDYGIANEVESGPPMDDVRTDAIHGDHTGTRTDGRPALWRHDGAGTLPYEIGPDEPLQGNEYEKDKFGKFTPYKPTKS